MAIVFQSPNLWTADDFCEHDEDVILECRYGRPFSLSRDQTSIYPDSSILNNRFEDSGFDEDEFESDEDVVHDDPVVSSDIGFVHLYNSVS